MLIVYLYVDDLLYTKNYSPMIENFKRSMMVEFDMTILRTMHYFLRVEVVQYVGRIFIS